MHPLVNKLGLEPHPEGGYYRQIYRSATQVSSPKHGLPRPAVTHIYFLLLKGQVSRFHRVLHDEIWNHYDGAPLTLYQLHQQQGQAVFELELSAAPAGPLMAWLQYTAPRLSLHISEARLQRTPTSDPAASGVTLSGGVRLEPTSNSGDSR